MRKTAAMTFVLIVLMMSSSASASSLSWDPVTTYTDNSTIPVAALPITYDAWWSTLPTFAGAKSLQSNGTSTSTTFDLVVQGMVRGTTVYFGARARTALGEVSADSPAFSWVVPNLVLTSLAITSGPASVNEKATATYSATATWNDGSTTAVTPVWSVTPSTYASISSSGVLTATSVTTNQSVTVGASFTAAGVTQTASRAVAIINSVVPSVPGNMRVVE